MAATPCRRTGNLVVAGLLSAFLALLGAGCGALEPAPQRDTRAELALRPPVEEMVRRYDHMLERVRDRLDAELGPFAWRESMGRSEGSCDQEGFAGVGARTIETPTWTYDGNLAGDGGPRAQRIVADLAAEYGFADPVTRQVDDSGGVPVGRTSHGVDLELGAFYNFSTQAGPGRPAATSIRVTSGCHLPARLHSER
jgi:hypothetical protein